VIKEIYPGDNRTEYSETIHLKSLPTGLDGCSDYKDFELPKD
jgi:hypothetical protein